MKLFFFLTLTKGKALSIHGNHSYYFLFTHLLTSRFHGSGARMGMGHEHHLPLPITQFCTVTSALCEVLLI